jgi:hypothetical protein
MDVAFTLPFMYWVGTDEVGTGEVLTDSPPAGFELVHRYELLKPDARGDYGPKRLTIYESGEGARALFDLRSGALSGADNARWRLLWRRLVERGTPKEMPDSLFIVGMTPAADADETGIRAFNDFYTNIHVPEVMTSHSSSHGTRFELLRAFKHLGSTSPRYVAIYELDAQSTAAIESEAAGGPAAFPMASSNVSVGPPAWEHRNTAWRLFYRRVDR